MHKIVVGRAYVYLLLVVIFLGTGLRICNLGSKSLWIDEGTSIFYADTLVPSMVNKLIGGQYESGQQIMQDWQEQGNPPLFYILLRLWMRMGRSEAWVRLLSAVWGVISIAILYQFAKTLFSEQVGLLSAWLLATSPLHIAHSQNARMYTLVVFLVLLSVYCVVSFFKTGRWVWRIGYVLCAALSLYTHYITVFAFALQNAIALIFIWQQKDGGRLLVWLAMQVSVLLLFAPWVPFVLYSMGTGNDPRSGFVFPAKLPLSLFRQFSLGGYNWDLPLWMIVIGLLGFLVFVLWGIFAPKSDGAAKENRWKWLSQEVVLCLMYLCFAGFGSLLLFSIKPFATTRMALFGLPAYYVLVARGIERIPIGKQAKLVIVLGTTALLLFSTVTNIYARDPREDWWGAANYILSESQAGDVVVLHAFYCGATFNYYVAGQNTPYADLVEVDHPLDDVAGMIRKFTHGHRRMWLVLSHVENVDPDWQVKEYMDSHYSVFKERSFAGIDVILYDL